VIRALRRHWPEALAESLGLGLFMISACCFGVLLEHPSSPVRQAIASPLARRALMGLAMGATAVALVHSPWGKRSGAHLNPAVTLAFLRLGKVRPADATAYLAAQFAGAVAGVAAARALLGSALAHPSTRYVVTRPGPAGAFAAFVAEVIISFALFAAVVLASRSRFAALTGLLAGFLVFLYITVEAPISGMSMNPARSFGSAAVARDLSGLWIYFTAPPLGMLAAAIALAPGRERGCAKLDHSAPRCIFCGKGLPAGGRP
jgi:aquaporin Z